MVSHILSMFNSALAGTAFSFLIWLVLFPLKVAYRDWMKQTERLDSIKSELEVQRTNCLATLQRQGERQIASIDKAVDTLNEIRIGQAELNGVLKGILK